MIKDNKPINFIVQVSIDTKYGRFIAYFSNLGLLKLNFPEKIIKTHFTRAKVSNVELIRNDNIRDIYDWIDLTCNALTNYFDKIQTNTIPPLDITNGTEFQKKVWKALQDIKWGETRTYGELARIVGCGEGARAVGLACGANPIPIFIPCHRVIAANGSLGGFSAGLNWKKLLLSIEDKANSFLD